MPIPWHTCSSKAVFHLVGKCLTVVLQHYKASCLNIYMYNHKMYASTLNSFFGIGRIMHSAFSKIWRGVSLLLAPAGADKRGRRPLVLWGEGGGGIWACPPENFVKSGDLETQFLVIWGKIWTPKHSLFLSEKSILLHSSRQSHVYCPLFSVVYIQLSHCVFVRRLKKYYIKTLCGRVYVHANELRRTKTNEQKWTVQKIKLQTEVKTF